MSDNHLRIKSILEELSIRFEEIEHEINHTCEESKKFRDDQWLVWLWSKNIVFHCKWKFYLVVTHWDKQIKARNFKKVFWSKDIRFASQEEITPIIGSMIWSIPPFGFLDNEIMIFVDAEIFKHGFFIFNPSIPTRSIRIPSRELKRIYWSLENEVRYFMHEDEKFEILSDSDVAEQIPYN
ncbi:MAG: hypothetical protein ACD_2C00131G0012 [uncultured bacterium (gcode 4)]|uniref:YbaK/aminoacyl-tRNA synthetase-associated domain-containing protein n=1 Tax=uncultured bacterium (gcode 4) TaxID=1234023 RepID=K2G5Y5_9BACT|nr:MAG: hypothetical protein ACD_2C00131G0012 [uncultured bacterium (gcode 4)]